MALMYTRHVYGMFRLSLSLHMSFCCSFAWRPETKAERNLCQSAALNIFLDAYADPNLNN